MDGTDDRILTQRLDAVRTKLATHGHDALIVYARGSSAAFGSKSHGYMRYLCDWDTYYSPGVILIVTPEGPPAFITSDIFLQKLTQELRPHDTIIFSPLPALAETVHSVLREREKSPGRPIRSIACLGRAEAPAPFWEGFAAGLAPGAGVHDFEPHLAEDLAVKDAAQYALHQKAAAICDGMFAELDRLVPAGLSEWHLRTALEKTAKDAGCEHVLIWTAVGPVTKTLHFYREDSTRVPQQGDQVLCGIYALYRGHWGHGIRMGSFAKPTDAMLRGYDAVLAMEEAGIAALQPGQNLYGVNDAMEEVFNRLYPGPRDDIFRFRTAHGLGHFSEDPLTTDPFQQPYFPGQSMASPENAVLEIREGMLLELHPNVFQRGVTGAAIGDMVYVGPNGPELMLKFPREFRRWGE